MDNKLYKIVKTNNKEIVYSKLSKYAAKQTLKRIKFNPANKDYNFEIIPMYPTKKE